MLLLTPLLPLLLMVVMEALASRPQGARALGFLVPITTIIGVVVTRQYPAAEAHVCHHRLAAAAARVVLARGAPAPSGGGVGAEVEEERAQHGEAGDDDGGAELGEGPQRAADLPVEVVVAGPDREVDDADAGDHAGAGQRFGPRLLVSFQRLKFTLRQVCTL